MRQAAILVEEIIYQYRAVHGDNWGSMIDIPQRQVVEAIRAANPDVMILNRSAVPSFTLVTAQAQNVQTFLNSAAKDLGVMLILEPHKWGGLAGYWCKIVCINRMLDVDDLDMSILQT